MAAKPKTQLERFKAAARELEADDDVGRFEARLGRLKLAKKDASATAERSP